MLAARPMAGPQPEMPLPATPMPRPYLSVISLAVASAASLFKSTQTMCAPSLTRRCAVSLPMPEPAPITTTTWRASSFSAGMRWSFASSSSQYSMSKASCCGQRDVFIDRLRAAHHFDGAVVKLRGDARFGLVLAPRDHAEAGNEHDGRSSDRASRASWRVCRSCSKPRSPCGI